MPPRLDNIIFETANVFYRNFGGLPKLYNTEGDRNFCLGLDSKKAEEMQAEGWNVKYTKVREEGDEPKPYIQVAVKYENYPPQIYLITRNGTRRMELPEDQLLLLDGSLDIKNWDVILSPSRWDVNGNTGIKAYLKKLWATVDENSLDMKYMDLEEAQDPTIGLSSTASEELVSV